jgi:predicted phage terminase large subunit-like protein
MQNPLNRIGPLLGLESTSRLNSSLAYFAQRAWRHVEPGPLIWNWHHNLLCEYLQLVYERKLKRLIVTIPPRMTKSKLASVIFPAWCWAKNPALSFIATSYSDQLSVEFSVARRNLLSSNWFRSAFPGRVEFAPDQNQKSVFQNTAFGVMRATSMTGAAAGVGADILIVDDPLALQSAYSDADRLAVNRDFDGAFRSRLNSPNEGCIVIICQRLHQMDLVGHLLENEPDTWKVCSLPMVAERDEEIVFPVSGRRMLRKEGDLLQPSRFSAKTVAEEKRVNTFRWASQYQQRPSPQGGAIFKTEWLQRYDTPPTSGTRILALDTAFSVKKTADFSAASVWTANEDGFFLRHVWRGKVEYPALKMAAENLAAFWKVEAVVIEEKGSGQSLVQSLRQETRLPVVGWKVENDKVSRAYGVQALFASGKVFVPRNAPWLPDFLNELELFPFAAHDDQVDTVTMALGYLRDQMYEHQYGVLDWQLDPKYRPRAIEIYNQFCAGETVNWARDVFGVRVANPGSDNSDAARLFPIEARVRGLDPVTVNERSPEMWKKSTKCDPCRFCGSSSTVALGLAKHCNQCARDDYPNGRNKVVFATRNGFVERDRPE